VLARPQNKRESVDLKCAPTRLEILEVHRRKELELAFHVVVEGSINGHRASHSSKMVRGINPGSGRMVAQPEVIFPMTSGSNVDYIVISG
jgi:hypothetical protein